MTDHGSLPSKICVRFGSSFVNGHISLYSYVTCFLIVLQIQDSTIYWVKSHTTPLSVGLCS
jgi:hypothetical protein